MLFKSGKSFEHKKLLTKMFLHSVPMKSLCRQRKNPTFCNSVLICKATELFIVPTDTTLGGLPGSTGKNHALSWSCCVFLPKGCPFLFRRMSVTEASSREGLKDPHWLKRARRSSRRVVFKTTDTILNLEESLFLLMSGPSSCVKGY